LTDTVGFIQNLPAYIIDAFHSTLEEIEVADVVLLIVDVSEKIDTIVNKLKISLDELVEIGVTSPVIITFNKIDKISENELIEKKEDFKKKGLLNNKKIVYISVKEKININSLLKLIHNSLPRLVKFKLKLPINNDSQSLISWIYERALVIDISYNEYVTITIECDSILKDKIISKSNKF